jgi:hypothetical protein
VKTYGGSGCVDPHSPDLDISWGGGLYPWGKRLGGPQIWHECCGEQKIVGPTET